jgi:hypothetical protein
MHKISVRTSQKTQCASIRKKNQLILYREIIVAFCEDYKEHTNTLVQESAELLLLNKSVEYVLRMLKTSCMYLYSFHF